MTKYFLTVPHDSAAEPTMATMDPAELEAALAAVGEFNTALKESGAFLFAGGLYPPSTAKTVDVSSGEPGYSTSLSSRRRRTWAASG